MTAEEREIAKDLIQNAFHLFAGMPVDDFVNAVTEVIEDNLPGGGEAMPDTTIPPNAGCSRPATPEAELKGTRDSETLRCLSENLARLGVATEDRIRHLESHNTELPAILSHDATKKLQCSVLEGETPWGPREIEDVAIPGMISREECLYYSYIGQFYSGVGAVLELGPWLGRSTFYILRGLEDNPNFRTKKLHVFDDFVWRSSWMNDRAPEGEHLENHQDFRFLFDRYTASFENQMMVEKRRIVSYDGNDSVPPLEWDQGPVEIMYVDCGRTLDVNNAWFGVFADSFMPDRTLIIMQDWRRHREIPVQWYNQTKLFTDSKADQLQLVHELQEGDIATFLYRG